MKRTANFFIALITLAILVIACGESPEQGNSLQAKKDELKKLKNELVTLSKSIQDLESDIATLDTTGSVKMVAVTTNRLTPKDFQHFVKVQGQVTSNKNIQVSPKTSGIVTKIYVREGQSVKTGQLLAKLDDAVMQRNIEEVRTQLELATILFEKQKNLWEQEVGTEVQYLTAKSQKESLDRRLATLEEQLDMANIKSPISGVIDAVGPKIGEMVNPGFPAFRVVNLSDLRLETQLSESYVPYIRKGDKVRVSFPALNSEFDAQVSVVGQMIDPGSRTFRVEVKLPYNEMLKPNMFGEISINDRTRENALVIPQNLLQKSEKGSYLYIATQQENGKWAARRQDVVTGLSYNGEVEITQGLTPQDQVIVAGFNELSDGQPINLNETAALNQ